MTATHVDAQTTEHPIGPDGFVVIRLRSGDVRLQGTDGDRVIVRSRGGRSLRDLAIETGDGSLSIGAESHSADLDLDVPAGVSIVVEAASADLSARGLGGDQRYRTSSGDVILSDVGGTIAVEAVSGDVEVTALGGSTLSLRTVSGDVSLAATTLLALEIATTSGEVEVAGRFDGDGPFRIESVSGDTRLSPVNDVRVEMETISGDLSSRLDAHRDDSSGRRVLVIGQGGPTISIRSTSGDARVDRERVILPVSGRPPATFGRSTAPTPPNAPMPELEVASDIPDGDDLEILRALERGEIDTAEAGRRLADLDARSMGEGSDV
ncbi:MAG: DUF4097 family beta strand repeat-containing protein [Candidatus Limnocylindrales bacterium]